MSLVIAAAQCASVPGDIARNVANHLRFARAAAAHGVRLLVFPELSLTGYELALARQYPVDSGQPVIAPLRDFATEHKMTLVVGAPVWSDRRDVLHIGALVLQPDRSVTVYTKQHVHSSEEHVFRSGLGGVDLDIGGTPVALAICRDAKQPEHAANAARRGAKVYAVGAFVDQPDYPVKARILQDHARRHAMAVLLANYSGSTGGVPSAGRSTIWSSDGSVVAASAGTDEELLICADQGGVWSGAVVAVR